MKKANALLLLFFALSLHAQGTGALAKMDKIAAQAALAQKTLRPITPLKPVHFAPPTYYNKQFARMERTVQRSIAISPQGQLWLVNYTRGNAPLQYQLVMKSFLKFKQEADPFLYYQTKNRRPLNPEEKRQWLVRIFDIKRQLASLRGVVSVNEPSIREAYTYLNEVLRAVAPSAALFELPKRYQKRFDRAYQPKEFFLHAPSFSTWRRTLHWAGIDTGSIKPLPKNLKIAIFNDNDLNLSKLKKWHKEGKLLPENEVVFSQDAYELLHLVLRGTVVPDVIITDICSRGTDGMELTQELRNAGYNGAIIALTGYKENEISGNLFMEYGFDGMISNDILFTSSTLARLLRCLQYYFYYRDLHGWIR